MRNFKKIFAAVLVLVLTFALMSTAFTVSAATLTNLFDKSSSDIWLSSLTYNGTKLTSGSYANIFTTHKINVKTGDTIYWGYFGAEDYCMEIYDANGNFLKQVKTAEVTANYTGASVNGVSNNPKSEAWYYYKITTSNAGYVRILGNTATMDTFQVYLNLSSPSEWPGKSNDSGESTNPDNLFVKSSSDIWYGALSYNGSKLVSGDYSNIFTTHKINVKTGDTIYWGYFGAESYCMEIYDASGNFLKQVSTAETTATYTGVSVNGVSNNPKSEAWYYYKITTSNAGYVRILGNVSTIDTFQVYLNLSSPSEWPGKAGGSEESENSQSVLYGKSVLFCGDSITNAVKDEKMPYYGWAGRIGTAYGMSWKNAGVSGASLSTIKSSRIITQLHNNKNNSYNYVILHGGVNDAMTSGPIGTLTTSKTLSSFDVSTMAGALDEMFYYAKQYWPNAKIGYIVNYATPNSNWGGNTKDMSAYFAMAKQVCDKWEIPYIDLYSGYYLDDSNNKVYYSKDLLNVSTGTNFYNKDSGEVHIGSSGYALLVPHIANFMENIGVAPSVKSIYISKAPTKTEYVLGESIDLTGLVVMGSYTNNTSSQITGYTTNASSVDKTTVGQKTITITYKGFTTTFSVNYVEPPEPEYSYQEIEVEDLVYYSEISNNWVKRYVPQLSGRYCYHTTKGGKFKFAIEGDQFSIISYRSPSQGKMFVSIDGADEIEVPLTADLYDTYFKDVVYTSETLEKGKHYIDLRFEGTAVLDAIGVNGDADVCDKPIYDDVTVEIENILDAQKTGKWTKVYAWKLSGRNALKNNDGGSIKFDFDGDAISILSYKANSQGKIFVSIDNGEETEVDLYDDSTDLLYKEKVFTKKGLQYGTHTVTIRTEGTVFLDAAVIHRVSYETVTVEGESGDVTLSGNWSKTYAWPLSAHNAMFTSNGGSATFTYTGYDFRILSYKATTQGKMYVSIDGGEAIEVDLYDSTTDTKYKEIVLDAAGLDLGTHTVEITTTGKVVFDAVEIDGELL